MLSARPYVWPFWAAAVLQELRQLARGSRCCCWQDVPLRHRFRLLCRKQSSRRRCIRLHASGGDRFSSLPCVPTGRHRDGGGRVGKGEVVQIQIAFQAAVGPDPDANGLGLCPKMLSDQSSHGPSRPCYSACRGCSLPSPRCRPGTSRNRHRRQSLPETTHPQ